MDVSQSYSIDAFGTVESVAGAMYFAKSISTYDNGGSRIIRIFLLRDYVRIPYNDNTT